MVLYALLGAGAGRTGVAPMSDATLLQTSKERDAAVIARQLAIFERDEFRALAKQLAEALAGSEGRDDMRDPCEPEVESLCERIGYGVVMDCAARLWQRKSPGVGFALSNCRFFVDRALDAARKAGLL